MDLDGYNAIRDTIQDGDLVFIGRGKSFWSKLTQLVTRSKYFHVAVCFWMKDPGPRLMVIESSHGGRRITSLSSYLSAGHTVTIVRLPPGLLSWPDVCEEALGPSGAVKYGYADYVAVGAYELFGIRLKDYPGEICSEFVAKLLRRTVPNIETAISPGQLFRFIEILDPVELLE